MSKHLFVHSLQSALPFMYFGGVIWAASWQKNNKMACAPSENSDQPGYPPSLIRVFAVRLKKSRILIYPLSAQRRLWSDWADAQADLSLRWAHMPFCWFCDDAAHLDSCSGQYHYNAMNVRYPYYQGSFKETMLKPIGSLINDKLHKTY